MLLVQARAEYRRRTYDLNWIFKYDERFNSEDLKRKRVSAARLLKQHAGNLCRTNAELAAIDDVLDFLDELGFDERGGQITPEVLHQNFHYWIRGYYSAAREYIEAWRKLERSRWEHIEGLNSIVHAVDLERNWGRGKLLLSSEEVAEFLGFEIGLGGETQLSDAN